MTYNNNLIKKLNLSSKTLASASNVAESKIEETMADPRYLRQSSSLINDALQKGFDVLQLADGDIVMTGVKTVVYQYSWDDDSGKLVRTKASSSKENTAIHTQKVNMDELDAEDQGLEEDEFSS